LGVTPHSVYKILNRNDWDSGRPQRRDKKTFEDLENRDQLENLILTKIVKEKYPGLDKGIFTAKPTKLARLTLIAKYPELEEFIPGIEQLNLWLRRAGLSPKQLATPASHITLTSDYSNHVHQADASIPKFCFDPKGNLLPLRKSELHPGKLLTEQKKKIRLNRLLMVDHKSHAVFPMYFEFRQTIDWATFFYHSWRPKPDILDGALIFEGVPDILVIDLDKALRSHAMMGMYKYLGIRVPALEPESPQVKGSVEKMMDIWEAYFESSLFEEKPKDIDELNRLAWKFAVYFQTSDDFKMARHGMTRFAKWRECIDGHLRICPDWNTWRQLLHTKPEPRKVNGNGVFHFKAIDYKLENIHHTWVDVIIHPYLYSQGNYVTVRYPSEKLNKNNFVSSKVQILIVAPAHRRKRTVTAPCGLPQNGEILNRTKKQRLKET
jgi:hypothetical protein